MSNNPLAFVIEDDTKLARIFEHTLKSVDFEVEVLMDGEKAMSRLGEIRPDLILLDLHLPFVSGDRILAYIRGEERLHDVRVIIASADGVLAENLPARADTVLLKPISVLQLQRIASRFKPQPPEIL